MIYKFRTLLFLFVLFIASSVYSENVFHEITVKKGETLAIIAKTHLEDPNRWKELLQYNKIETPNLIFPGMKIKIPDFLARSPIALILTTGASQIKTEAEPDTWEDARSNQKLYAGDMIRTGKSGFARIAYRTGITINMSAGSELVLNGDGKPKSEKTDGVFLRNGSVKSIINKANGNPNPYYIRTPTAVASVRGTVFNTTQDETGNMTVTCETGIVAVEAAGKTVLLHENEGTRVRLGEAPMEPVRLPFPPAVTPGR